MQKSVILKSTHHVIWAPNSPKIGIRLYLIKLKDIFAIITKERGIFLIIKNIRVFLIFQYISGVYMIFFLFFLNIQSFQSDFLHMPCLSKNSCDKILISTK